MTVDSQISQTSSGCRFGELATVVVIAAGVAFMLFAGLFPSSSAAATTRLYEESFGFFKTPFGGSTPAALAVDQSNGDIYAVSRVLVGAEPQAAILRFSSDGTPKNFTSGPDAGTNVLTGFPNTRVWVAIDNSGGPLSGTMYALAQGENNEVNKAGIKVFASSGANLGKISGSGLPVRGFSKPEKRFTPEVCGLALDQSSGALYVSEDNLNKIWRFAPTAPAGDIDDSDYSLTGITADNPCDLAANGGDVYARSHVVGQDAKTTIDRFDVSSFSTDFSNSPTPTTIETGKLDPARAAIAVDPSTGDLYLNRGDRVSVFDSAGRPLYSFGAPAYFRSSEAIAVKSANSGPAAKVYVADPGPSSSFDGVHEVDVFGGLVNAQTFTHKESAETAMGPDGTSGTSFPPGGLGPLAFDQAARRLYAADGAVPGIYGFDASAPPAFPSQAGFSPLGTAGLDMDSGFAVDNTALASTGNLYLASQSTDLLYGWDSTGISLGGAFPVDPAVTPGAPDGSPKNLCGSAVDSEGNIWVSNSATKRILKYNSAGASLPGAVDTSAIGSPCNLGFDSGNDLYVGINGTEGRKSGVWKYTAASGYTSATRVAQERPNAIFAVEPSTGRLYAARESTGGNRVEVYNAGGQLLDEFALGDAVGAISGIAVDATNEFIYIADSENGTIHAFAPGLLFPEVDTRSATAPTNTTITLRGLVNTQGISLSDCHFEYVTELAFVKTGFSELSSGGSVPCNPTAGSIPLDLDDHPVSAEATGLVKDTGYRFRLSAANADGTTASGDAGFTTAGPPLVETTGSPVRTATTARLEGRVYAARAETTYRFEYGTEGPCDSNPCESTETHSAGASNEVRLVSQWIEGLEPNTTYHYRVIADNGNPPGPAIGNGMTVITRSSDTPLSHGDFPGPPGSDRAWEQVSLPDTGGNPVSLAYAVSDRGDRAYYRLNGGVPLSATGSFFSALYAEREETGPHQGAWQTRNVFPPRHQLVGPNWLDFRGRSDLSEQIAINQNNVTAARTIWRLRPDQPPTAVLELDSPAGMGVSEDLSRVLMPLQGSLDPTHPVANSASNLYDVSTGSPRLVGLMPDGSVPACGSGGARWVSPDGSLAFFESCEDLYLRDFDAEQTKLISPESSFARAVPNAVFFATTQGFDPADKSGRDLYRYDLGDETSECVTCVVPDLAANVDQIVVAQDGSRAYFTTSNALLPGVANPGVYRVEVGSGDLAYVAPGQGVTLGDEAAKGQAISPDAAALILVSSNPGLNAVGGQQNDGTLQYYRYDDRDRSLTCLSCPQDGSLPVNEVQAALLSSSVEESGAVNKTTLSADGKTFAFATNTPLVSTDQNTARSGQNPLAGGDVYEWRDGRVLLVTDGLTNWPKDSEPRPTAITPSGDDIFFTAAAQYTPDALDGFRRLYDARIGGGFKYPVAPKPCPLEVCQGTPQGSPEEQAPGTGSFTGSSNVIRGSARRPCPTGRHKARRGGKTRCVKGHGKKQRQRQRAKHDRRAQR